MKNQQEFEHEQEKIRAKYRLERMAIEAKVWKHTAIAFIILAIFLLLITITP